METRNDTVAVIATLNREFVRVVQMPELKSRLTRELSTPVGSTPGQLASYLKSEIDKWAAIIKVSGARAD